MTSSGRSEASTVNTRSGRRSTIGASRSSAAIHAPHVPFAGNSASRAITGNAKRRRCSRLARSRVMPAARGESCSRSSASLVRNCASSPASRRAHRSLPPMTADSTSSCSHFHGARSVPSTTG